MGEVEEETMNGTRMSEAKMSMKLSEARLNGKEPSSGVLAQTIVGATIRGVLLNGSTCTSTCIGDRKNVYLQLIKL